MSEATQSSQRFNLLIAQKHLQNIVLGIERLENPQAPLTALEKHMDVGGIYPPTGEELRAHTDDDPTPPDINFLKVQFFHLEVALQHCGAIPYEVAFPNRPSLGSYALRLQACIDKM